MTAVTDAEFYELTPVTAEVDRVARVLYEETRPPGSSDEWPNHATRHWHAVAAQVAA